MYLKEEQKQHRHLRTLRTHFSSSGRNYYILLCHPLHTLPGLHTHLPAASLFHNSSPVALIKSPKVLIFRGTNEYEPSFSNNRAAIIFRTRLWDCRVPLIPSASPRWPLSHRYSPVFKSIAFKVAPWWLDGRIPVRIKEAVVSHVGVSHRMPQACVDVASG